MGKMKAENIEFITSKNLTEIVGLLRQAADELKATVDKIGDADPLAKFEAKADIEVVLWGNIRGFEACRPGRSGGAGRDTWVVQVYVTEIEEGCHVELIAIGEGFSLFGDRVGTYYCGRPRTAASIERRDKIAAVLR